MKARKRLVADGEEGNGKELEVSKVKELAGEKGWKLIAENEESRVVSFSKEEKGERINVYYTTGTVGTCLEHPLHGATQLFRRAVGMDQLKEIFVNPRTHTGKGYYEKKEGERAAMGNERRDLLQTEEAALREELAKLDSERAVILELLDACFARRETEKHPLLEKEREVVVVKPRPLHVQDQGNFGVWNLVDEDAFARSFEGASCIAVGDGGVFCMCYHWVRCKHDVSFFFPPLKASFPRVAGLLTRDSLLFLQISSTVGSVRCLILFALHSVQIRAFSSDFPTMRSCTKDPIGTKLSKRPLKQP